MQIAKSSWIHLRLLFCSLLVFGSLPASGNDDQTTVLIVYYSESGQTKAFAEGIQSAADSIDNVRAILKEVSHVDSLDLVHADGIIIGSPTYYANMAAPIKQFIDNWYYQEILLFDKVGGAFATGGGRTAGRELVVNSILMAMLNNGMIVAGPLYSAWGTFGSSAITAPPDEGISASELDDAHRLGRRIAELAKRIKNEN